MAGGTLAQLGDGLARRHAVQNFARLAAAAALACAMWLAPAVLSRAAPEDSAGAASLTGQLLVAAPGIADPRFEGTVIFLIHHGSDGAFGVAINRPVSKRPLSALLDALGEDGKGVTGEARVFSGGPVALAIGVVLHTSDYRDAHTVAVGAKFAITSDSAILRAIAAGKGPKKSLIAFGYAGWGPGQLEDEMSHNDWYVTPATVTLVFDEDRGAVWQSAYDKRTMRL
jgi:putative transcriptional regulator